MSKWIILISNFTDAVVNLFRTFWTPDVKSVVLVGDSTSSMDHVEDYFKADSSNQPTILKRTK